MTMNDVARSNRTRCRGSAEESNRYPLNNPFSPFGTSDDPCTGSLFEMTFTKASASRLVSGPSRVAVTAARGANLSSLDLDSGLPNLGIVFTSFNNDLRCEDRYFGLSDWTVTKLPAATTSGTNARKVSWPGFPVNTCAYLGTNPNPFKGTVGASIIVIFVVTFAVSEFKLRNRVQLFQRKSNFAFNFLLTAVRSS